MGNGDCECSDERSGTCTEYYKKSCVPLDRVITGINYGTHDATKNVRAELIETALTLGANRRITLFNVVLPAVLPDVMVAMRQMLAMAWTYLVIAEIVASTTGIGAMMMRARRFLNTDEILAGILVIGALGLLFDLLFAQLHRWLFPYLREKR